MFGFLIFFFKLSQFTAKNLQNYFVPEKFSWDRDVTFALITEYKKYRHEFHNCIKKKKLWGKVAQNLITQGFIMVSSDHCEKKWRSLKKTFKASYKEARHSNKIPRWGFYEALKDIFANDPVIVKYANLHKRKNEILIDSKNKSIAPEELGAVSMDTVEDNYNELENTDNFNMIATAHTEEQPPPNWFLAFYQQYKEAEERKIEILQNMHSGIMALGKQLETIIKNLPCKMDSECESSADNINIKTDVEQ